MLKTHFSRMMALVAFTLLQSTNPVVAQDTMGLQLIGGDSQSVARAISIDELDALEQVEFTTSTIWTDDKATFSGVSLATLVNEFGVTNGTLQLIALNDYAVSIPIGELENETPILATRMNGEQMSVREKGPFWVVYNYDSDAKYRNETIYSRSIWQLNRIKVVD